MANFEFLRGKYENLPAVATDGALYFTKDATILMGLEDGSYKEYGSVTTVASKDALPASASPAMLFYCELENVLAKYDTETSAYIQINLDTNTTYEFAVGSKAGSLKIVGKNKAGNEVSSVEVQVVDVDALNTAIQAADDKAVAAQNAVDTLAGKVGSVEDGKTVVGMISDNATEIADLAAIVAAMTGDEEGSVGSISEAIKAQIDALDVEDTAVEGQFVVAVSETDGKITVTRAALKASDIPEIGQEKVTGLVDAIADAKKAGTDASDALDTYKTTNDAAVAAAKKAADDEAARAKDAEKAIEDKIGEVADGKTVVEMISEAQTAATYDDTQVKADIKTNADNIAAIVADYLKKADKDELVAAIATAKSEAIATIMGEAGVDAKYDTLKEVADWILSDTTNSAELVAKVNAIEADYLKGADKTELQKGIDDLEAFVGTLPEGATSTTVVAYIQEAINALKIGDYAKASDLTSLTARVKAVEDICAGLGALATLDEVTEDVIAADVMAKINASAEGNHAHDNKAVLDGITDALIAQWNEAYAKAHEHTNKAELDKVADGDVAKWNAAEQNAKDYADGLAGNYDKAGSASTAEQNAKDYADGLADNYDEAGAAATAETNAKAYADSLHEWGEF